MKDTILVRTKNNYNPDINKLILEYQQTNDKKLLEKLVKNNMGLVIVTLNRFKNCGIEYDDLFQEGVAKLIESIKGYQVEKGASFANYAMTSLVRYLYKYTRSKRNMIHFTDYDVLYTFPSLNKIEEKLGILSDKDLSDISGVDIKKVWAYRVYTNGFIDIEAPLENDMCYLYDTLIDKSNMSNDSYLNKKLVTEETNRLLSLLNQREQMIIKYRYGYIGDRPLLYREIARIFNISGTRVREIEQKALRKMRRRSVSKTLRELLDD